MHCQISKKQNVSEYYQESPLIHEVFLRGGPTFQNPEGGGAGSTSPPPPYYISFLSNTGRDPLKITKLPCRFQCLVNIGTPPKCHLNGISLVGGSWPKDDHGPFIVEFGSSLSSSTKK